MSGFFPTLVFIQNITNAQYAVITFTTDHLFVLNERIGLRVSRAYGMSEINNQYGKVLALTSDSVTVDIDTTNYTPFSIPVSLIGTSPPCAVPATSGVNQNYFMPTMILDDAFDNRPN